MTWALIAALGDLERFHWIQLHAGVTLGTLRLERGGTDKSHSGISSLFLHWILRTQGLCFRLGSF